MKRRLGALALASGIVGAACGGGAADPPVADDGSVVTLPEPAEGPPPSIAVDAESATSPLPDLAVRRINGEGGWVNLKNEIPSDQPLLVWFWAPH